MDVYFYSRISRKNEASRGFRCLECETGVKSRGSQWIGTPRRTPSTLRPIILTSTASFAILTLDWCVFTPRALSRSCRYELRGHWKYVGYGECVGVAGFTVLKNAVTRIVVHHRQPHTSEAESPIFHDFFHLFFLIPLSLKPRILTGQIGHIGEVSVARRGEERDNAVKPS